MRILVAEDDAPLAEFLRQRLREEQFSVELVSNAREAEELASQQSYDLVLLDLNLPAAAGLDVLRGIRSKKPDLPVLVVTGSNLLEERIRGLDAGADDYIGKPFAFAELAARIRAVLRRGNRAARDVLQIGDLELDRVNRTVRRAGYDIELSPKEFSLLEFLMRHEGQPIPRSTIVEKVWKLNLNPLTNVVDVYINYLRRKIDSGHERTLISYGSRHRLPDWGKLGRYSGAAGVAHGHVRALLSAACSNQLSRIANWSSPGNSNEIPIPRRGTE